MARLQPLPAGRFAVADEVLQAELKRADAQAAGEILQLGRDDSELHHQQFHEVRVVDQLRLLLAPVLPALPVGQRSLLEGAGHLLERGQAMGLQPEVVTIQCGQKGGLDRFDLFTG